ncbi:MAG TPA: sigma-70 region 4 domain-containing protein [Solirubrobacteraceae bacterium]|nr:sigma-70 region 4 domain-containing protein [Solirubrobacteraceae bacterium]
MASLDELPPDQRATLQLLLKQGRSYDEIATLLKIEPRAVRERARAGLDALGPEDVEGLALDEQDDVADYLLGQQSASRRAATRDFLAESAAGRAWARAVAGELRPLAGDDLPEIPSDAAEVEQAFDALDARKEHHERVQKSSKVGGALLVGALVIVLVAVVLLVTGAIGGDDDDGGDSANVGKTTTTTTTTPKIEAQINLTAPEGRSSKLQGVAQVATQNNQRAVALVAQGLPAASENRFYAVWLYSSPSKARRLGFPEQQPTNEGTLQTGFEWPKDAAEFKELVVSRESSAEPKAPTRIELRGAIPKLGG